MKIILKKLFFWRKICNTDIYFVGNVNDFNCVIISLYVFICKIMKRMEKFFNF